jgi:hypothetical protein
MTFVFHLSSPVCVRLCLNSSVAINPQEKMPPSETSKPIWYRQFRKPKRDAGHPYVSEENVEGTHDVFVHSPYKAI